MSVWIWTLSSVLTVSLASFVGLVFMSRGAEHLDSVLMYLVSLAAGVLLGGAFFHLIPEAYEIHGDSVALPLWVLTGFLGFFFLERFLWAHHHGHGQAPVTGREPAQPGQEHDHAPAHGHAR
ncbi:MAG: ZIP family metal transporter, partial [Gemmatimonadota bacterium]